MTKVKLNLHKTDEVNMTRVLDKVKKTITFLQSLLSVYAQYKI